MARLSRQEDSSLEAIWKEELINFRSESGAGENQDKFNK